MGRLMLSDEEKRMLAGEHGAGKRAALQFIVEYAEALGADRLVEVSKAQIFIGAHNYLNAIPSDDIDLVISEMYLNTTDRITLDRLGCFVQTDTMPFDSDRWKKLGISPTQRRRDLSYRDRFRKAGAVEGGSCASYMIGFIPIHGEHYVSTESHALLFMNSMWGARANADSIEASVCSAVCGRTPFAGMHVSQNRLGTHLVHVEAMPTTIHEWDLLGYAIGERLPPRCVPVLAGNFETPNLEKLKSFFASMATSSSAELCHIVGLTPEAPSLDAALGGKAPVSEITVTTADMLDVLERLSAKGRADLSFVSLGCPHYSLEQIKFVADRIGSRSIAPSVTFQVWTANPIRDSAVRSGLVQIIEAAGGSVLTSSCPLVSETVPDVPAMAFDSAKQAKYVSATSKSRIFVGSASQCIEAAISGFWTGLPAA